MNSTPKKTISGGSGSVPTLTKKRFRNRNYLALQFFSVSKKLLPRLPIRIVRRP